MPLVDVEAALEELGLDKDDFMEFVGDLKEFVSETLPQLDSAQVSDNKIQIRELAHSIKGAVANLRFLKAAEVAQEIERIGAGVKTGDVAPLIQELKSILESSYAELGL
jgi:HPt (histidine-containing phosphotransfer) domain-containing protein